MGFVVAIDTGVDVGVGIGVTVGFGVYVGYCVGVSNPVGVPALTQAGVSVGDGAGVSGTCVTTGTVDSESLQDTRTSSKPKISRIFNVSPFGD